MDQCGHQHQGCTCRHDEHHHDEHDHHHGHHGHHDRDWDVVDRLKDGVEDAVEDGVGFVNSLAEGFKAFMRKWVVPAVAGAADVVVEVGTIAGIVAASAVVIIGVASLFGPVSLGLTVAALAVPGIYAAQNYVRGECGWVYRTAHFFGTLAKDLVKGFGDNVLFAEGCATDAPEPEAEPRAVPAPEVEPHVAEASAPEVSAPEVAVPDVAEAPAPEAPALLAWQKARATRAVNEQNLYGEAYDRISKLDSSNPRVASREARQIACTVVRDSLAQNDHRGRALHYGVKRDGLRAVATGKVRGIQNIQDFLAQEWARSEVVREQRAARTGLGVAA